MDKFSRTLSALNHSGEERGCQKTVRAHLRIKECLAQLEIISLLDEILAKYLGHGWQPERLLLTADTRSKLENKALKSIAEIPISAAAVDAIWFSRASKGGRAAWELRLLAETPYALFETFGPDTSEEQKEDARSKMEARLEEFYRTG